MLMPKRVKFRKQHRGRMAGKVGSGNEVFYGECGLMALEPAWVTGRRVRPRGSPDPSSAWWQGLDQDIP